MGVGRNWSCCSLCSPTAAHSTCQGKLRQGKELLPTKGSWSQGLGAALGWGAAPWGIDSWVLQRLQ